MVNWRFVMNDATTFAKPGIGSYNFGLSFIVKSIFVSPAATPNKYSLTKWYEEKFNVVLPIMGLGRELLHIRSQHQIHVTVTSSYRHFNWRRRPCVAVTAERRKEEILLTTLRPIT